MLVNIMNVLMLQVKKINKSLLRLYWKSKLSQAGNRGGWETVLLAKQISSQKAVVKHATLYRDLQTSLKTPANYAVAYLTKLCRDTCQILQLKDESN